MGEQTFHAGISFFIHQTFLEYFSNICQSNLRKWLADKGSRKFLHPPFGAPLLHRRCSVVVMVFHFKVTIHHI